MMAKTIIKSNKNNVNLLFRCDKHRYLESMLKNGEIHFSNITSWINGETSNHDCLEGAFRFVTLEDNYYYFTSFGKKFARDKRTDKTFGFCMFGVGDNDFASCEEIDDDGVPYKCCYLKKTYLEPYKGNVSDVKDYYKLDNTNRMKLIYITHPELFIHGIVKELKKFGFNDDELFFGPVIYIDKYNSSVADTFPMSLFYKHFKFKAENEIRIIIYSSREELIKKFEKNRCNIKIGSIKNYSKMIDFPYENIQIKKENGLIIFDTPNRFFLSNYNKTWAELCERVILLAKRGVWINNRQKDELEVIKKILWEKHGIIVEIGFDESIECVTKFTNANPKRNDVEFNDVLQLIWNKFEN